MESKKADRFATKRFAVVALLVFASGIAVFLPYSGHGQNQSPEWPVVLKALRFQNDAVKSVEMLFQVESFNSDEEIKHYSDAFRGAKASPTTGGVVKASLWPWELTPNRVLVYRWQVAEKKWHCARTRVYPTIPNQPYISDFATYDGEKLFTYDDFMHSGRVLDAISETGFFGSYDSNPYLGIGGGYLQFLEKNSTAGTKFSAVGAETINGEFCAKYVGVVSNENGATRFSIWVCPLKDFAVMKYKDETFAIDGTGKPTANGAATIFTVLKLTKSDETYFSKKSKIEYYRVSDRKLYWRGTDVFNLNTAQINADVINQRFNGDFPPGTTVIDYIKSPGQALFVGGESSSAVERVTNKNMPPQEEVNGSNVSPPEVIK